VLVLSGVTYEVVCSYSYSNKGKKEVGGKFRLEIVNDLDVDFDVDVNLDKLSGIIMQTNFIVNPFL